MKLNYDLETPFSPKDIDHPLMEYPRPHFRRDSYLNLNGIYNFEINQTGGIPKSFTEEILVPYPVESSLSRIKRRITDKDYLIYSKEFYVEESFIKDKTILHIDAVDQVADVYINGVKVGHHEGSYLPFIKEVFINPGTNRLDVVVKDLNSYKYPIGKQRKKRGGIWYTPISGIWQSIWMESVSWDYIKNLRITPNIDLGVVDFNIDTEAKEIYLSIFDEGNLIFSEKIDKNYTFKMNNPKYWTPENPHLYDIEIKTENDLVKSYFGYRKFSLMGKHFMLNNQPYFINGLLDQGYFSDGIYTPRDYMAYLNDIKEMKALGFNALRKHIKVEPMMFYYYCDTLGMLVLQDMVNVGKYSFFKDSVLPIVFKCNTMPYSNMNEEKKKNFIAHSKDIINYLYNVPSISYYTIFNEGWGEFRNDSLPFELKNLDPTRIYDYTSGWYHFGFEDLISYHIYFKKLRIKESDKPIIISEFGGYSYKDINHSFNLSKTFGYKKFKTRDGFEEAFIHLYLDEVFPIKDKIIGVIYTQVSDCEDETNGILTYDRRVCKLNRDKIKPIMDRLKKIE